MNTSAPLHDTPSDLVRDMTIRRIRTRILDIPTTRKHKLSNTAVTHQNYVHVEILFENGVLGYGEGSTLGGPRWAEESVEAIKHNIDTYLAPPLIGQSGAQVELTNQIMAKSAQRNFSAKCAVNAAIMDGLGRTLGVSVATLLGGAVRDRFPVLWALASGDAEQELEEAKQKIASGKFNRFKIKLGFADVKTDLHRLERLRAELPKDTAIIADVNQAWTEAEYRKWLPALEALDLTLIEQPLPAGEFEGMARITRETTTPVMLDESIFTLSEALRGVAMGAGTVLSLKLCKHGSMQNLQRIAGIASAGGLELYGGCLLESSLGAAAHLAVFATLPQLQWGCEHFGPMILQGDTVMDSLVYEDFQVHLPTGVGLGVTPNPDAIEQFTRKDQ